jgi:hypothetical protein
MQETESVECDIFKFFDSVQPAYFWGVTVMPDENGKPDILIIIDKKKGKYKVLSFKMIEQAVDTYLKSKEYHESWAVMSKILERAE